MIFSNIWDYILFIVMLLSCFAYLLIMVGLEDAKDRGVGFIKLMVNLLMLFLMYLAGTWS